MIYIDIPDYPPPAPPVQTPPSPEWTYGSLPISPSHSNVPLPISLPMVPLTVPSPVATPTTAESEGFLTELGAQVEMHGGFISDHAVRLEELSPALFKRSLEYDQERVAVTFGAIWRPMLAFEAWAELTEIIDGMGRGRSPERYERTVRKYRTGLWKDLVFRGIADGAQRSRVLVSLPEDPYKAIRQAYLDRADTESEAFRGPIDTEDTRELAAMSESEFLEDSDDEEDGEIEESMDSDSMSEDAKDEGPTVEDEDPAAEDEGLTAGVEGPDDEGHSVESDGFGLEEEEEAVPGGQQQAAPVVGTTVSAPLGLGYGALRHRELALEEGDVYYMFEVGQGSGPAPESEIPRRVSAFRQPTLTTWTDPEDGMIYIDIPDYPPPAPPVQTPPSPEWTSGLLPISPSHSDVPSPISSHHLCDHAVRLEDLSPALFERYDRDIGELFTRSGAVKEEIFSQRYRFRSLEYEQERVAVTFGAIWRPVLALEAWAEQFCPCASTSASALRLVARGRADTHTFIRKVLDRGWSQKVLERVIVIGLET
ncbi:hypothetical protein Tco_1182424 [Tanacetum coccineum]